MKQSLRVLLEGLIDYAGLFPPAALSMQDAVRNYARYRDGDYAFALGRFVVSSERLREVPREFPLTVLWNSGALPEDPAAPLETKAAAVEDVVRIASETAGRTVYVEIASVALLETIRAHRLRAKVRTGGITPDAFPAIDDVAAFIRACREHGVPFKATAGLHHPLRCIRPLTYAPDAPTGKMHGFLNVFAAAALLEHAHEILAEEDAAAFSFDDDGLTWRGHRATTEELAKMRRTFAISFGSCSFDEPIDDLRRFGWLD